MTAHPPAQLINIVYYCIVNGRSPGPTSMAITKTDLELSKLLLDVIPQIMRTIRGAMRDFKESDVTVPQFRALGFVSLQSCTNKQLAEWQGVSLPAMSRMVDYLVKRRLLVRTADKSDRRRVQLQLSKKGKTEFERLLKALEVTLAERITVLDGSKKTTLAAGLAVLKGLF